MAPHAHREGHLIFHIHGPPAEVVVDGRPYPLSSGQAVAVSPWQPHFYRPLVAGDNVLALVLYIRPGWFVHASCQASEILRFGRVGVEVSDRLARLLADTSQLLSARRGSDGDFEDRLSALTQACFDQTWQWTAEGQHFIGRERPLRDFRIRRALRLLDAALGEPVDLARLSRAAGLSRPHFFKLFREQIGLPPTIYVNALRMERAIERLALGKETVADIGLDLGFSTPASFSRFFIANGVVPPSTYRRSVLTHAQ
ncbi:MAG: AraC family transcriptional regulator [Phreatobacter sp.]|uniref:AraC family transcriptional regulator n=1 Tax=Phreatobacter sp. TaxID=1966341 RepID=UPI002732E5B9|nr:AraC family transcriptional regulator [Phreatobacter sp.]MDP2801305.1 AraC family transcriptional regulator [Phreatobacter sp.]